MCSSSLVSYSGILSMHYLKKTSRSVLASFETRGAAVSDVSLSSDCHRALHSAQGGLSRVTCLDCQCRQSSGSAIIGTLRSNDEDGNANVEKINRFYEQTTTLNKQTKFYPFLNMVMVPKNSTPGWFAYIRQSKRVMLAIKTERTQIHFKRRSRCRRVVGS